MERLHRIGYQLGGPNHNTFGNQYYDASAIADIAQRHGEKDFYTGLFTHQIPPDRYDREYSTTHPMIGNLVIDIDGVANNPVIGFELLDRCMEILSSDNANCYVSFSGNKGFHITCPTGLEEVRLDLMYKRYLIARLQKRGLVRSRRRLHLPDFPDIFVDLIYDTYRYIRMENTLNSNTMLYKTPIDPDTLKSKDFDLIRKYASRLHPLPQKQPSPAFDAILQEFRIDPTVTAPFVYRGLPSFVSRKSTPLLANARQLLDSGDITPGTRHDITRNLLWQFRSAGYTEEEARVRILDFSNKVVQLGRSKSLWHEIENDVDHLLHAVYSNPCFFNARDVMTKLKRIIAKMIYHGYEVVRLAPKDLHRKIYAVLIANWVVHQSRHFFLSYTHLLECLPLNRNADGSLIHNHSFFALKRGIDCWEGHGYVRRVEEEKPVRSGNSNPAYLPTSRYELLLPKSISPILPILLLKAYTGTQLGLTPRQVEFYREAIAYFELYDDWSQYPSEKMAEGMKKKPEECEKCVACENRVSKLPT